MWSGREQFSLDKKKENDGEHFGGHKFATLTRSSLHARVYGIRHVYHMKSEFFMNMKSLIIRPNWRGIMRLRAEVHSVNLIFITEKYYSLHKKENALSLSYSK